MHVHDLLASDIDNTLTGDETALRALADEIRDLRERGELWLVLSTGRRIEQVIEGFEAEGIPVPDAVIGQVGTEIFLPPFRSGREPLEAWAAHLHEQFDRATAIRFLEGVDGLVMQPDEFNTQLKVSCFLDGAPDPEAAATEIRGRVARSGGTYQVVWSSGKHLDILPAASGKGRAIRFLIDNLGLEVGRVIAAGDSGNDRSMFDEFGRGVIVANAQPELRALAEGQSEHAEFYFARAPYAAGVSEGLRHFGVLRDDRAESAS